MEVSQLYSTSVTTTMIAEATLEERACALFYRLIRRGGEKPTMKESASFMETSVALLGSSAGIPQMKHRRRRTTRTIRNLICSVWGVALMNRIRSTRGFKKRPVKAAMASRAPVNRMVQAGRFDVAYCVGTVTIGRRRSGAACQRGGPAAARGRTLLQARDGAAPPCSTPGADWGGPAPPPCRWRGPSDRSNPALPQARQCCGQLWPALWLCRPCPPPAAWRGPGRPLLGNKYSVAACWKAALLWLSKWEIDVNGVGA